MLYIHSQRSQGVLGRNLRPDRQRTFHYPGRRFPSVANNGHLEHWVDLLFQEAHTPTEISGQPTTAGG